MDFKILTVEEVAERLKVSPDYVRDHAAPRPGKRARAHPLIPVIRLGSGPRSELRFRDCDIDRFLSSQFIDVPQAEG